MPSASDAVWISVLPDMSKFGKSLSKGASGEAEKAGKESGGRFSDGMKLAVAAGAAAIGATIAKGIADNINIGKANDKLAAQLGLSVKESARAGATAGRLYRNAYGENIEQVNDAVGAVMSSIKGMANASGRDLERVTAKTLDFATAFEVDVQRAAQVAGQAVSTGLAKDADQAMDLLTSSMQRVPAAVREDLLDAVDEYGPFMKSLGLTGEAAFGMLVKGAEKGMYGIDKTGDALKEFTIRATDMSTSTAAAYKLLGLDTQEVTRDLLAGGERGREAFDKIIGGLRDVQDPARRSQAALALFGTPLEDLSVNEIPKFLGSLQSTRSGLGKTEGSAKRMGDTLNDNFGTRFEGWKRQAMGFVQDGLMAMVNGFTTGQAKGEGWRAKLASIGAVMKNDVIPFGRRVVDFLVKWQDIIVPVTAAIVTMIAALKVWRIVTGTVIAVQTALNFVLAANPIGIVVLAIAGLVAALVVAYKKSDTFRRIVDRAWTTVKAVIVTAWNKVIKPVFSSFRDFISETLPDAFRQGVDKIGRFWDSIKRMAAVPVNFLIDTVYNNGIRKLIGALPGVGTPSKIQTVSWGSSSSARSSGGNGAAGGGVRAYASGGVLPGYTPGRDVHDFRSPTGGRLLLSGGEAIMRPEFTRLVGGKRGVDALNRKAQHGILKPLRFFLGGVMPLQAGALTNNHGPNYHGATFAGDLNGPLDLASPPARVNAWQSGVVGLVRSIADSYGNHVGINHPDGRSSLYAHLSSIAVRMGQAVKQGQMLGRVGSTGNSSGAHLHFEIAGGPVSGSTGGGGNPFLGAIGAVKDFVGDIGGWVRELASMGGWGGLIKDMVGGVVGRLRGWINDKIPGPGPMPDLFDNGGWLRPGATGVNRSGQPEPVFNAAQWSTLRSAVDPILTTRQMSGRGGRPMVLTGTLDTPWGPAKVQAVAMDAAERVMAAQENFNYAMGR